MKKLTGIFTLVLVMIFSLNSFAQLSKAEKKEWKKKAKEYSKNPDALKQLVEDNEVLQGQVSKLTNDTKGLQSRISDKDAKLSEMQDDLAKLRSDLASAKAAAREVKTTTPASSSGGQMVDGVVFKVQIGAFKNKDLSKYFENNENFGGESGDDGLQKITLGQFRDYWEANTFKKYLREMGVKDAWIVPYQDGNRVEIKDVLEGVAAEDSE